MRLIDADKLKESIKEAEFIYDSPEDNHMKHDITDLIVYMLNGMIDEMPTVGEGE